MAFIKVSSFIVVFALKYIWLPPIEAALSLIGTISSSLIFPFSIFSITIKSVIILVILAIGNLVWLSSSLRIVPVDCSIKMLDLALVSTAKTLNGINNIINRIIFFISSPT